MKKLALNEAQRELLRRQIEQCTDELLRRRTLAMLQLDQGKSVAAVASSLNVTRQTIYNWLEAYTRSYNPLALVDAPRSGRPTFWSRAAQEHLELLLVQCLPIEDDPPYCCRVSYWRKQLASYCVRSVSEDTVRRRLREMGFVWERTHYVLPDDAEEAWPWHFNECEPDDTEEDLPWEFDEWEPEPDFGEWELDEEW